MQIGVVMHKERSTVLYGRRDAGVKVTCGNLLALLAAPEKLMGNNGSPAQHLSWHNIKR